VFEEGVDEGDENACDKCVRECGGSRVCFARASLSCVCMGGSMGVCKCVLVSACARRCVRGCVRVRANVRLEVRR
jgi:hypothetical protein